MTTEDGAWRKIDNKTDQHKNMLAIECEKGLFAKSDLTIALKELRDKQVQKDAQIRTLEEKRVNFEDNKTQTIKLKADKEQKKSEIIERDSTLKDKKIIILELKKKIEELEKFKFVLHFKINELKHDIGPREVHIKKLNDQVNTMHSELKHYNRVKEKL